MTKILAPQTMEEFLKSHATRVARLEQSLGALARAKTYPSTQRPDATARPGMCIFDIDLGEPLWSNGTTWVDATGNPAGTSGGGGGGGGAAAAGDATATTKGVLQLAGDLAGTAASPALAVTGVSAGTYGNASTIPVVSVDAKGRITAMTTAAASGSGSGSGSTASFSEIRPEDYGAVANGTTDDSAAFQSAINAASAAGASAVIPVQIKCQNGKKYRIATTLQMKAGVDLNLNGATLVGPITGYGQITSSTSAPSGTDMIGQVSGACIADPAISGSAHYQDVLYHIVIRNGAMTNFRFGIVTTCFAWAYPVFDSLTFYDCNIGVWTYQGGQMPRLRNCRSTGDVPGTTFVGSATAFPSGHTLRGSGANTDNYFTDELLYDGESANDRDTSAVNSAFDTWFQNGVLQPTASSISAAHTGGWVFPFSAGSDTCMVSGRCIYLPQRNGRLTFNPEVRRMTAQNCGRGALLIANPVNADIANVSGENMFQSTPGAMVVIPVNVGVSPTGVFRNIDANYITYTATYAVEVRNGSSGGASSSPASMVGMNLSSNGSGRVNTPSQWSLLP